MHLAVVLSTLIHDSLKNTKQHSRVERILHINDAASHDHHLCMIIYGASWDHPSGDIDSPTSHWEVKHMCNPRVLSIGSATRGRNSLLQNFLHFELSGGRN
ncbi:unnamed protein product [Allacma fusca]|uniref:Uncharacterized protein n=1 Tax=Allacma fusca TaxID=39272 RepID=A0A8J2JRD4_9HEXA|nr:unnamed protein product [Allacma fusca]